MARSGATVGMQAIYFDTADRRLAAAGVALRLRREGRRWVQTVKCSGGDAIVRLEHEVAAGVTRRPPLVDPTRHAGSPVAPSLTAALGSDGAALLPVFETRVERVLRAVRAGRATIEIAFDEGVIAAGGRELPLREIEFELLQGPIDALWGLAQRWAARHALWLDVRSKAERGDRLARGVDAGPVATSHPPALHESMTVPQALSAMVGAALDQVLPNAADVAGGVGTPAHLHQLRVGLRRLRSALRVFGDPADARLAVWQAQLGELFGRLGAARDRDVLAASLLPALERAGAPWAALPPATAGDDAGMALREPACTRLLLDLLAFSRAPRQDGPAGGAEADPLSVQLHPRLRRLHRRLRQEARDFLQIDDEARHRARKRAKRLRYGLEFAASVLPAAQVRRYLARLRKAQDALGDYNDLCVAEQAFREQVTDEPRAWYAVGWLVATRTERLPATAAALGDLGSFPELPATPKRRRPRQRI
jgi:inorganic triphosphatase YgiF